MTTTPLQDLLRQKQQFEPMRVYPNDVKEVPTEVNHFPYMKFYRGQYLETVPHIFNRDAGYAKPTQLQYFIPPAVGIQEREVAFQIPCSTILPNYAPRAYNAYKSDLTSLSSR